jgi:hypothetical protein
MSDTQIATNTLERTESLDVRSLNKDAYLGPFFLWILLFVVLLGVFVIEYSEFKSRNQNSERSTHENTRG